MQTKANSLPYTILYFLAFILLGMATSAVGPALPSLAKNTGSEIGKIGFLFTASSFGYLLGSLAAGKAYDRMQGNLLLAASLALTGGALGLIALIPELTVLTGVMFILGVGEGSLDVGANLLLVWVHKARATPYLNGLHFFFGLGALVAPMIVAQSLLRAGSLGPGFWLMGFIVLPIAAALLRLKSPSSPHASAAAEARPVNWVLVTLLSFVFFLYVGAEVGFGGWIFTYTTSLSLGDIASAAYLTSGFWGALMIGRLIIIPIASRFRPERLILMDFLGCVISMMLILMLPQSYAAVWGGALGLGLSMASIFPTLLAYADRRMSMTGQVTRWFFVGTGAGGMFLPWLMGRLFAQVGPTSVMWAVLVDLAAGLGVFLIIHLLEKQGQNVEGRLVTESNVQVTKG